MEKIRIFIVDDHTLVRQGLIELLTRRSDFQIVGEAGDGREALEKVVKVKPDIILLDISMPELNGLDAAVQIKKIWPRGRIIMLSMHDKDKYICSALSQGVSGYLLKDIDAEELFEAIDTVMAGGMFLSKKIQQQVIRDYADMVHNKEFTSAIDTLSAREREVFQLMAEGYSGKEIADKLNISYKTVEHHRYKAMAKLSCKNMGQIVRIALKEGIIRL